MSMLSKPLLIPHRQIIFVLGHHGGIIDLRKLQSWLALVPRETAACTTLDVTWHILAP